MLGRVDGESEVVEAGFGLQKYRGAVKVRRKELRKMREVYGAGGKEGESVVNVPGGEKAAECKLLGLAMFYVVGDVAVCVIPRLLAHGHDHVAKGWAGGRTHRCSAGLL